MPVRSVKTGWRGWRLALALFLLATAFIAPMSVPKTVVLAEASPIRHVVIIYQENHAFDNVLGRWCMEPTHLIPPQPPRCNGAEKGETADGQMIPLPRADDVVPKMAHGFLSQQTVINGGRMNGWTLLNGCKAINGYRCYQAFTSDQIPSLAAYAEEFVVSDATFQMSTIPTWGAHLELVAGHLNGFLGDNPDLLPGRQDLVGWGCDTEREALWRAAPGDPYEYEPSCVPKPDGSGPYRPSPVQHTPTIMDRIDEAGLSWNIYAPNKDEGGYAFAICPTFADCIFTPENRAKVKHYSAVLEDGRDGTLPNLSLVMPLIGDSQHNKTSMLRGDRWINDIVQSIMQGPDWDSTAIFITYDDCGCFYDHVPPPPGLGIRVPMVIVSPFAKRGYTDSNVASMASMLAFTESTFGLEPLWFTDRDAYDYSHSFDFTQAPRPPIHVPRPFISERYERWLEAHPPEPDVT